MSRHTSPARSRDEDAFPVRIKVRVPPGGLGLALDVAERWLREELEPGASAHHATTALYGSATAFYFRTIEDAARFLEAHPMLDLADGTRRPGW